MCEYRQLYANINACTCIYIYNIVGDLKIKRINIQQLPTNSAALLVRAVLGSNSCGVKFVPLRSFFYATLANRCKVQLDSCLHNLTMLISYLVIMLIS